MKPTIYFILLGVSAVILSMVILTHFMEPETAIYFTPVLSAIIVATFFLTTGTQHKFKVISAENDYPYEYRENPRYQVDHHVGELAIPDGTRILISLNDISSGGFQVFCYESEGQNLAQKISQLEKNESKIELTANIPFKKKVEQVKTDCKIAYFIKRKETSPYVAGLEFKDKEDKRLERLIQELTPAVA